MPEYTGFARKKLQIGDGEDLAPIPPAPFVELGVASPFSFLRGASDAIESSMARSGSTRATPSSTLFCRSAAGG